MTANAFKFAVVQHLLLTLPLVDWSQCDLVGKMVLWERNDPMIRYTKEYFTQDNASLLQIGGEQCLNDGLYHQNHGCMCRSGFNGEQCTGRERRETDKLQLACHKSLDANKLEICNCKLSEHSSKVMYCKVEKGQTCIVPQEHPAIGNVDVFQIAVDRCVIVPPPSNVCHPHLDYTDEPHPRPVIINMDRSVEGVFSTSAEVFSSLELPFETDIIIRLEPVVRTLPSINVNMGSNILLPCSYDGEVDIVNWSRGDNPLNLTYLVSLDMYPSHGKRDVGQYNTGHYNITDDLSLIIRNVTMEDAGRYYCEVLPIATEVLTRNHTDVLILVNVHTTLLPDAPPSTSSFPEFFMTPFNTMTPPSSSGLTTDAKILLALIIVLLIIIVWLVIDKKALQRRIREVSELNDDLRERRSRDGGEGRPMICENGMHGDAPV